MTDNTCIRVYLTPAEILFLTDTLAALAEHGSTGTSATGQRIASQLEYLIANEAFAHGLTNARLAVLATEEMVQRKAVTEDWLAGK